MCHCALLPGSYTQGSGAGFLICTHHITDRKSSRVDLSPQTECTENRPECEFQAGYLSLGGLAVTSVPHYTKKTESRDRRVCRTAEAEGKERQERSREERDREDRGHTVGLKGRVKKPAPPHPPPRRVRDRAVEGGGKAGPAPVAADGETQQEATKAQEPSELSSPCARAKEGSSRPVPAPRRMLDSAAVPVPAPRTSETTDAAGK